MAGLASVSFDRSWTENDREQEGFQLLDIVEGKKSRGVFAQFAAAITVASGAATKVYIGADGQASTTSAVGKLVGYLNVSVAAGEYACVQTEGLNAAGAFVVPSVVPAS